MYRRENVFILISLLSYFFFISLINKHREGDSMVNLKKLQRIKSKYNLIITEREQRKWGREQRWGIKAGDKQKTKQCRLLMATEKYKENKLKGKDEPTSQIGRSSGKDVLFNQLETMIYSFSNNHFRVTSRNNNVHFPFIISFVLLNLGYFIEFRIFYWI